MLFWWLCIARMRPSGDANLNILLVFQRQRKALLISRPIRTSTAKQNLITLIQSTYKALWLTVNSSFATTTGRYLDNPTTWAANDWLTLSPSLGCLSVWVVSVQYVVAARGANKVAFLKGIIILIQRSPYHPILISSMERSAYYPLKLVLRFTLQPSTLCRFKFHP